jgi:membrane-associated phospholipid phosphatase
MPPRQHVTHTPRALARQVSSFTVSESIPGPRVALGISACAFLGLVAIATRSKPNRQDVAITRFFQRQTSPAVAHGMRWISSPGYAPFTHSIVLSVAATLWALGWRREAIFTIGTMGAGFTTGVIKLVIGRPRPDASFRVHKRLLKDNSFPSGHATHYTAYYGYILYLAYRYLPAGPLRTAIIAYCVGLITLVGPSRIYLGHHWASDVVAGQLVGLTYLLVMLQVYEALDC